MFDLPDDQLLCKKEFCTQLTAHGLPLNEPMLSKLISHGRGPAALKFGGKVLIRWDDGRAWALARLRPVSAQAA